MIKRLCLLCLPMFVFLMVGCAGQGVQVSGANSTDERIKELENKITELEKIIDEQQAQIESNQEKLRKFKELDELSSTVNHKRFFKDFLSSEIQRLEIILENAVPSKIVKLNQAEIHDDKLSLNITYLQQVEVNDENYPRSYRWEETAEGTQEVSITEDVPVYLLDHPTIEATWDEVVKEKSLFKIYEIDEEIILIMQIF